MLLERIVFQALVAGIELCKKEPETIVEFFSDDAGMGLEPAEAKAIRDWFITSPPSVIHGYARPESQFPLYSVTVTEDEGGSNFLGDEGEDDDDGTERYASLTQYVVTTIIYSQNPDVTLYLFHLGKAFLTSQVQAIQASGLYSIKFSGGDLAPDPAFVPAGFFVRRLTVSGMAQYTQPLAAAKVGRATKVAGIHVDSSGDPGRDVGGVKTLVTVRTPNDADEES